MEIKIKKQTEETINVEIGDCFSKENVSVRILNLEKCLQVDTYSKKYPWIVISSLAFLDFTGFKKISRQEFEKVFQPAWGRWEEIIFGPSKEEMLADSIAEDAKIDNFNESC